MKTIIAGSRTIHEIKWVEKAVAESVYEISEVVCGMASGVDRLGRIWAKRNEIPVAEFPASWDLLGKRAGFVRNRKMADYADALIAVWDGHSKGTKHMIETATEKGLAVFQYSIALSGK